MEGFQRKYDLYTSKLLISEFNLYWTTRFDRWKEFKSPGSTTKPAAGGAPADEKSKEIEKLRSTITALNMELEKLRAAADKPKPTAPAVDPNLIETLRAQIAALQLENDKLRQQLSAQSNDNRKELEESKNQVQTLRSQITGLMAENSNLKATVNMDGGLKSELDSLRGLYFPTP